MGLFGEEFDIKIKEDNVKDLLKKTEKKQLSKEEEAQKMLKSKKITLQERLAIIKENVIRVLGKQQNNVLVIKDRETFHNYISAAIASGRIAIDTETNNSLDPVTCKLMGPCFYYPGGKQAYVPINHRDPETKERLPWQLTEDDVANELRRILNSENKPLIVMHNGKFDYEVLKCTTGVEVAPDWDTLICARLLNENEKASLKELYIKYVDSNQEKYSIDKLFTNVSYSDVEPDIFALYAATDSLMTDKIYELQAKELEKEEYGPHLDVSGKHEVMGIRRLFHEVEMPIVVITAEMELTGVEVDESYGEALKKKYNNQLAEIDRVLDEVLGSLKPIIDAWKLTPEASQRMKVYVSSKTKMTQEKIEATYPFVDKESNLRYKLGKAPIEQLDDKINLDSPTQLAILLFDILGVPNESKDKSRKTGKDELASIKEKLANYLPKLEEIETDLELEEDEDVNDIEDAIELSEDKQVAFKLGTAAKLADLILKRRKITKLTTTYIDVIPKLAMHWPDGRIRFHLNSMGTDTGRYSSGGKIKYMDESDNPVEVSGINIQNIPSHNPEIRMLFKAQTTAKLVETEDNEPFIVPETDDVETSRGWVRCKNLTLDDLILVDGVPERLKSIDYNSASREYILGV